MVLQIITQHPVHLYTVIMAPIKRQSYTLQTKHEAIQMVANGAKRSEVQAKFNIGPSTLSDWIKDKANIASKINGGKAHVKRLNPVKNPKTEEAVNKWFSEVRNNDVAVDSAMYRFKAVQLSKMLGEDSFVGSTGWFSRAKKRNNLAHRTISGEANSVDLTTVQEFKDSVPIDLLKEYAPADVYNCDEAGLQYNTTSKKTLSFKGQVVKGRKESKQRVTILFCSNMPGTDKRKMLVIGHFLNPRAMGKDVRRPCPYLANKKAWMTSQIFEDYLRRWDRELTQQKRRIALVLDNATCHPKLDDLVNIKLVFLPPATTSHTQPMDQGIIANFKRHYRFLFTMGHLCPAAESGRKLQFNILLALKLCVQAWDAVTPRTISRCFQHAGFKYPNDTVLTPEEEEEEALPLSELARRLNSAGHLTEVGRPFTSESLDHALTEDEHLQTTGMSTLEDIASEVQGDSSVSENGPEEEADQDPPAIPQHSEFIKCLEVVERYMSFQHGSDEEKYHLQLLQLQAWAIRKQQSKTQTTLDKFFAPKK